ncbi:MAG TPA: beta-propeller fold lactonase family protein, partial [Candidatus Xenobia bacterium]
TLNVTTGVLQTITITPSDAVILTGTTQQLTATGHFSDGSSQDLTSLVTWSSDTPSVALISSSGLATAGVPGTANVSAGFGLVTGTTSLQVKGRFVYAAVSTGSVAAFIVDPSSGALTPTTGVSTPSAFGLAADPQGRFLYVTNDNPGTVSGFRINPVDGTLTPVPGAPVVAGSPVLSCTVDRSGQFLYVPALGRMFVFQINQTDGSLQPVSGSPFFNPSSFSVTFDATNAFLYSNDQIGNAVNGCLKAVDGSLTPLGGSPFADGWPEPTWVVADPAAGFLYASGFEEVLSAFSIDPATGALTPLAGSPFPTLHAGGNQMAIDNLGRFLFVAGPDFGGEVGVLSINPTSGLLTPVSSFGAGSAFEVAVDGSGHFVYTANAAGSVGEFTLDASTGNLTELPGSPLIVGPVQGIVTVP